MNRFFEALRDSRLLRPVFQAAGASMESPLRHWLHDPTKILQGAEFNPGDCVVEVGCGTGFFTVPAARMLGERGRLIAIDALPAYVERVKEKTHSENLNNVRVLERDALHTGLTAASVDAALLFGVIPFPALPLGALLPEMHRILRTEGILSVWLWPPLFRLWVPRSVARSGLFSHLNKQCGVYNYRRCHVSR